MAVLKFHYMPFVTFNLNYELPGVVLQGSRGLASDTVYKQWQFYFIFISSFRTRNTPRERDTLPLESLTRKLCTTEALDPWRVEKNIFWSDCQTSCATHFSLTRRLPERRRGCRREKASNLPRRSPCFPTCPRSRSRRRRSCKALCRGPSGETRSSFCCWWSREAQNWRTFRSEWDMPCKWFKLFKYFQANSWPYSILGENFRPSNWLLDLIEGLWSWKKRKVRIFA